MFDIDGPPAQRHVQRHVLCRYTPVSTQMATMLFRQLHQGVAVRADRPGGGSC